jgi:hypothetical protein
MAEAKPKKYMFVSNRDITVASTEGYAIAFEKSVPMHVPRAMHTEVMEKGILPVDGPDDIVESEVKTRLLIAPDDADERADAISDAIRQLVKGNDSHNFSAGGVPSAGALSGMLGWKVDAREIRTLWTKIKPDLVSGASK